MSRRCTPFALALLLAPLAAFPAGAARSPVPPTAARVDSLIRPGESHFAELWQLTFGGENAEAYWSGDGRRIVFQSTRGGRACDQIYVMDLATGATRMVSGGVGRCTCGFFYDHDRRVLFSSTRLAADTCPPTPDPSRGYVWPVYGSYDIFTARPDGSDLKRLTSWPGYDAEATVSPDGQWIVFTSMHDEDLDVYKMHPDGTYLMRLTRDVGYDGGPFFSHDGQWICYRAWHPPDSLLSQWGADLTMHQVRPSRMDLWVMRADGSDKRQVTHDPGASFAPSFTPDDKALIYSTNREHPESRDFDLYLVALDGKASPEPVTRDPLFDGDPAFSPDGQWLLFESNRGHRAPHETNVFLARWRR